MIVVYNTGNVKLSDVLFNYSTIENLQKLQYILSCLIGIRAQPTIWVLSLPNFGNTRHFSGDTAPASFGLMSVPLTCTVAPVERQKLLQNTYSPFTHVTRLLRRAVCRHACLLAIGFTAITSLFPELELFKATNRFRPPHYVGQYLHRCSNMFSILECESKFSNAME